MTQILAKVNKWVMIALMLAGVVFTVLVFATDIPEDAQALGDGGKSVEMVALDTPVGIVLTYAYIVLILGVVAVLFGIVRDIKVNPKGIQRKLIIVAGIAVVVLLAYFVAPGTPLVNYLGEAPTAGELKLTDTIIYLTYFTMIAAVGAIIFGAVYDKIKK